MTAPLPPLGLDDIRAAGPDRDNAEAFDPRETWWAACDAINAGHKPADVAALLLGLEQPELEQVRDWWRDECRDECQDGGERDAKCPDLALCQALVANGLDWFWPSIDATTVLPLLAEVDSLRAAADEAHAILFVLRTSLRSDPGRQAAADRALAVLSAAMHGDAPL